MKISHPLKSEAMKATKNRPLTEVEMLSAAMRIGAGESIGSVVDSILGHENDTKRKPDSAPNAPCWLIEAELAKRPTVKVCFGRVFITQGDRWIALKAEWMSDVLLQLGVATARLSQRPDNKEVEPGGMKKGAA